MSMEEEKYLIEHVGRKQPFRVPEDYFDTLTSRVMGRIDAETPAVLEKQPKKAKTVWMRPVLLAAASVCALVVSVAAYHILSEDNASAPVVAAVAPSQADDDAFDEAADYAMMDNMDIYACLADF